jgi:hypothetical protein
MPKVSRDERLAAQVRAFIEKFDAVSAAATALGVSKTLLWRFDRSGCAIGRTRTLLADALAKHEKETASAESETRATPPVGLSPNVPVEELLAMRALFQNMLNVIDAYVANPSGNPAMGGLARSLVGGNVTQSETLSMLGGQHGQS